VFEEFCKNVGEESKKAKAAAERAAHDGFRSLMEEFVGTERRVAAELEAAAAAAAEEALRAEEGEVEDGSREGEKPGGEAAAAPAPRGAEAIPEAELDGLSYDGMGTYWGADERWAACPEALRRELFEQRFGAAIAASAERREVRGRGAAPCAKPIAVKGLQAVCAA
jgi:hypothetical protein